MYTKDNEKAKVLNSFNKSHTILNEQIAVIPDLPEAIVIIPLSNIILSPLEVESILKTLQTLHTTKFLVLIV